MKKIGDTREVWRFYPCLVGFENDSRWGFQKVKQILKIRHGYYGSYPVWDTINWVKK